MIYCDLDGVLADFDNAYRTIFGVSPQEIINRTDFWQNIEQVPDYWFNLKKMPDADLLISQLKKHPFKILTGLPHIGYFKAENEKKEWVKKHLGSQVKTICCLTVHKAQYCQKGDILIDDWPQNIERWENAGGIGILHTNASSTICRLKDLGF